MIRNPLIDSCWNTYLYASGLYCVKSVPNAQHGVYEKVFVDRPMWWI